MHNVVFVCLFFICHLEWHIVKTNGRQSGSGLWLYSQLSTGLLCHEVYVHTLLLVWLPRHDVFVYYFQYNIWHF